MTDEQHNETFLLTGDERVAACPDGASQTDSADRIVQGLLGPVNLDAPPPVTVGRTGRTLGRALVALGEACQSPGDWVSCADHCAHDFQHAQWVKKRLSRLAARLDLDVEVSVNGDHDVGVMSTYRPGDMASTADDTPDPLNVDANNTALMYQLMDYMEGFPLSSKQWRVIKMSCKIKELQAKIARA